MTINHETPILFHIYIHQFSKLAIISEDSLIISKMNVKKIEISIIPILIVPRPFQQFLVYKEFCNNRLLIKYVYINIF